MKLLKIDTQGYFIEDVIVKEIPMVEKIDGELVEDPLYIKENCPNGFYRPKWEFTNNQWVEGASQEEIDAIKNKPQPKTEIELLKEELATTQEALNYLLMNGGA